MSDVNRHIEVDWTPIIMSLQGITFSESETAKIRKMGKAKVSRLFGTEIKAVQKTAGNGRVACDAWSVIKPILEQCVLATELGVCTNKKL